MEAGNEVLHLILDINSDIFIDVCEDKEGTSGLAVFTAAICGFTSLFRSQNPNGQFFLHFANETSSKCIYSTTFETMQQDSNNSDEQVSLLNGLRSTLADFFVNASVAILGGENDEHKRGTMLAGSLAAALCCFNKLQKKNKLNSEAGLRILIVKLSLDERGQHVNLMNMFFTALKQGVIIDCCTIGTASPFMEQGCDITGGVFSSAPKLSALFQYLNWFYLPSPSLRGNLILAEKTDIQLGPECFCHQKLVATGWVCSVCLSISCKFSPICSICQTVFKFVPPVAKMKRKQPPKQTTA